MKVRVDNTIKVLDRDIRRLNQVNGSVFREADNDNGNRKLVSEKVLQKDLAETKEEVSEKVLGTISISVYHEVEEGISPNIFIDSGEHVTLLLT